jgi:hypothetical protein
MPLTYPYVPVTTVVRSTGSQTMVNDWVGKYNLIEATTTTVLTLTAATTFTANAEIIIRNYYASTQPVSILAGSGIVAIDVSPDLGLVIPIGGIGELKRLGSSNIWSFYGYIEA